VNRLGVGVGFKTSLAKLSVEDIAGAVRTAWTMRETAADFGKSLSEMAGLQQAANAIQQFLLLYLRSGLWDMRLRDLEAMAM